MLTICQPLCQVLGTEVKQMIYLLFIYVLLYIYNYYYVSFVDFPICSYRIYKQKKYLSKYFKDETKDPRMGGSRHLASELLPPMGLEEQGESSSRNMEGENRIESSMLRVAVVLNQGTQSAHLQGSCLSSKYPDLLHLFSLISSLMSPVIDSVGDRHLFLCCLQCCVPKAKDRI